MSQKPPPPDWVATYAAALAGDGASFDRDDEAILELARDVAHGTERKNAPLVSFLAGRYVERRVTQGATAQHALQEALEIAQALLPSEPERG